MSNLDLIEGVIAGVGRRQRLHGADREDFASVARLHIIENDYAVLRRFEGRSSLETYLAMVVTRQFQDWRNARWGKWRCSAVARRLGPLAERLERLLVRDRFSLDEAHQMLTLNHGMSVSRQTLEDIAAQFPVRAKRSFVSDDEAGPIEDADAAADELIARQEAAVAATTLTARLSAAIATLPPDDALLLRLRYWEDISVANIARLLRREQMPLYRRLTAIRARLLAYLVANGVAAETARGVLVHGGLGDPEGQEPAKYPADVRQPQRDAGTRRRRRSAR